MPQKNYYTPSQVAHINTAHAFAQFYDLSGGMWPMPNALFPDCKLPVWRDMTPDQKAFFIDGYEELQAAIEELSADARP